MGSETEVSKEYSLASSPTEYKKRREDKGIKAAWVAAYVGVSASNLCKWENGERNFRNEDRLKKLSEALDKLPEMKVSDLINLLKTLKR